MIQALGQPLAFPLSMNLAPIGLLGGAVAGAAVLVNGVPLMINGVMLLVSTEN